MSLKVKTANRVSLMTFARPEARNAFNESLRQGLRAALSSAAEDNEVGAIVLTGEGTSFCAGVDLGELAELSKKTQGGSEQSDSEQSGSGSTSWDVLDMLRDFPKPVIMAINGTGVGLGTTILGFADIAIASEAARFRCPFTEMGVGAEASSTWLLPHLVGWQNASWILLSSEWIDAAQAKDMGLVGQVVKDKDLLPTALGMAEKIASRNLDSILSIKAAMNSWRTDSIARAAKEEGQRFTQLLALLGESRK